MTQPNINLFVSGLINPVNNSYKLSIEISSSMFRYVIFDQSKNIFIGLKEYIRPQYLSDTNFVNEILVNDQLLSINFIEVVVIYQSWRTMLIPQSIFNPNNLNDFLKFHHEVNADENIKWNSLFKTETFCVYVIPNSIENELKTKFTSVKFYHHTAILINNTLSECSAINSNIGLNINFGENFFNVLITRNQKVILFNSFFYKTYTDIVYFLANILNLYSITPGKLELIISGEIENSSEITSEMQRLFGKIVFAPLCKHYNYSELFSNIEAHKYSNILNSFHCELLAETIKVE